MYLKNIPLLACAALLLLSGCAKQKDSFDVSPSGKITTTQELVFDFGTVAVEAPYPSKVFTFTNEADTELTITGGNSSCGCTMGHVTSGVTSSEIFSMDSPLNTDVVIPPHEDFSLTVSYNPAYHGPDFLGERDQLIYIVSSSKQNGSLTRKSPFDGKSALTEIKVVGEVTS